MIAASDTVGSSYLPHVVAKGCRLQRALSSFFTFYSYFRTSQNVCMRKYKPSLKVFGYPKSRIDHNYLIRKRSGRRQFVGEHFSLLVRCHSNVTASIERNSSVSGLPHVNLQDEIIRGYFIPKGTVIHQNTRQVPTASLFILLKNRVQDDA
jgi:hypothetical protein